MDARGERERKGEGKGGSKETEKREGGGDRVGDIQRQANTEKEAKLEGKG